MCGGEEIEGDGEAPFYAVWCLEHARKSLVPKVSQPVEGHPGVPLLQQHWHDAHLAYGTISAADQLKACSTRNSQTASQRSGNLINCYIFAIIYVENIFECFHRCNAFSASGLRLMAESGASAAAKHTVPLMNYKILVYDKGSSV